MVLLLALLNNDIILLVIVGDLIDSRLLSLGGQEGDSAANPVDSDVAEDVDEANSRDDVGDSSALGVSDRALNRWENCSSRNTHDKDTSSTSSVVAEVSGTHGEDGGVHGSHEEEDGDEDTDTGNTPGSSTDVGSKSDGTARVDNHDELRAEDDSKTSSDESTDSEGDESIAQHVATLGSGDVTVLVGIVDEEGSNGDLGTDVAELSTEGEPHVPLLPDGALSDVASLVILKNSLADLGKLGEEEEDTDGGASTGDSEVDILDVGEVVLVLAGEEELGGDEGTDEGSDTVPRLAELETSGGRLGGADDDSVRVGGSFESSETASDNESASAETTKDSATVGVAISRLGNRPEQNSTERVESETHQDGELVAAALEDLSGNGREEEITATKVHDLQASGLELCDAEDGLEMLVEDIEKTVGETPEEEEGDDEGEGVDEGATL